MLRPPLATLALAGRRSGGGRARELTVGAAWFMSKHKSLPSWEEALPGRAQLRSPLLQTESFTRRSSKRNFSCWRSSSTRSRCLGGPDDEASGRLGRRSSVTGEPRQHRSEEH